VFADGVVDIDPVVVDMLVKTPVDGVIDPIELESIVDKVIAKPD
jgi:hypothetical protein